MPVCMTDITSRNEMRHLWRAHTGIFPASLWERIVLLATAIAEAGEMDAFGYLDGRIAHLERGG